MVHSMMRLLRIVPVYRFRCAERGFIDVAMRWPWCVATEPDTTHEEGVGGAKHASDIVHAAHIVQHNREWKLFRPPEFLDGFSAEIGDIFNFQSSDAYS